MNNSYEYPEFAEFYDIKTDRFNIPCWQIEPDFWRCGLLPCNFNGTFVEIYHLQNCVPCELGIMKEILKTYTIDVLQKSIIVVIDYPFQDDRIKSFSSRGYGDFLKQELGILF